MPKEKQPHDQHRERMRRRAREEGVQSLAPHEALELLLYYAIPRVNTNDIAHALLDRFGSFSAVLDADPGELCQVPGVGESAATFLTLLPQFFALYGQDRLGQRPLLDNRQRAGAYCVHLITDPGNEAFFVLCLDAHKRLLHRRLLFSGTPNEAPVLVRKVAEYALQQKACSILLCHNHPSGSLEPSAEDYAVTRQIADALAALQIPVDDHVLVADGRFACFFPGDEADPFAAPVLELANAADTPDPRPRRTSPKKR